MRNAEPLAPRPLIAVVDDDASVREALEGLLLASRLRVVTFSSAEAMLRHQQLDAISCLISDVKLGGKSGLQLHKELVGAGYSFPTIIITAFADEGYRGPAMECGAIDFLTKPILPELLLQAVDTALKRG